MVLSRGKAVLRRVRANEIEQVLLFGRVELTSGAVALLARRGIDCVWLRQDGRFRARLAVRAGANVPLRLAQYRATTDAEFCARTARNVVAAKLRYQRAVLLRAQRRLTDADLAVVLGQMRLLLHQVASETSLDRLRGLEGQGAALYFSQFGKLLRAPAFSFTVRTRRPPRDPVNACLSFGYAVLGSLVESRAERAGLDPTLGFFHQPAYGRPSLALDVLEEFRPLVDSLVLRLLNRHQLGENDFERRSDVPLDEALNAGEAISGAAETENQESPIDFADGFAEFAGWGDDAPTGIAGAARPKPEIEPSQAAVGVYLGEAGRRIYLSELFRRLRERVYYPPRESAWEIRDIITQQLYHLARVIDGREPEYLPFIPD